MERDDVRRFCVNQECPDTEAVAIDALWIDALCRNASRTSPEPSPFPRAWDQPVGGL